MQYFKASGRHLNAHITDGSINFPVDFKGGALNRVQNYIIFLSYANK